MVSGLFRVLFGFVIACLVAGAVKVGFAVTPAELAASSPDRLWQAGEWALLSATETAVFSAPFALIAIMLAEWIGIRSFAYHGIVGILIAAAGFAVLIAGETPETAGLANSYAIAAFLTTGLMAGVTYWLFAGRLSGGRRITRKRLAAEPGEASPRADSRPETNTPPAAVPSNTAVPSKAGVQSKASVPTTGTVDLAAAKPRPRPAGAGSA